MTTSIAQVDIANMALDMLEEGPISTLDDDNATARRIKRNFDIWRDAFLEMHNWNFATVRESWAADSSAPAYDWKYRYVIPGDCLRVLPLQCEGEFEGRKIPFVIEGGYLLTDQSAPLRVRYIKRITQYGQWQSSAVQAFAAYIAAQIAHSVTGKASYAQIAEQRMSQYMAAAKRSDGMQGTMERSDYSPVISARYGYAR